MGPRYTMAEGNSVAIEYLPFRESLAADQYWDLVLGDDYDSNDPIDEPEDPYCPSGPASERHLGLSPAYRRGFRLRRSRTRLTKLGPSPIFRLSFPAVACDTIVQISSPHRLLALATARV